ncbi:hypothetical protein ABR36_10900 [Enterobacter ludwigii]|nr:hypothetical protein ABR36_10900 [Enterobacter ludwigii]
MSKRQRKNRKYHRNWLARLAKMWPQAFDLQNPRPLAVGIMDAIAAELNAMGIGGLGTSRIAVHHHTTRINYLRALAAGGPRYNLHGEPEGEVTAEQQQRAAETLKAIAEKIGMSVNEGEP